MLDTGKGAEMASDCEVLGLRRAAVFFRCAAALAIALVSTLACLDRAAAAPNHPLDPLTGEELGVIRDVLAGSGRFSPETKFAWIELEEPAKARVERFEPGQAFPRRARLAALDFGRRKSFAVTIDLAARRLDAVEDLGALQPGLTDYDLDRARRILDADPRVKDALVRHGLQIPGAVSDSVRELSLGVGDDPSLRGETGRLVRVLFIADQEAINDFGPVLDSVMAVVDVYGGRVVQLYEVPGVPNRKAPHDLFDPKIRGAGAPAKPVRAVAAQGANFAVDGNIIRWENWRLRLSFNVREGLVLHQVRFDDAGRERSILYRASVAEVISRYGDPTHAWPAVEFLDEGNFGLGTLSVPARPGREVPANAVTLSPVLPDPDADSFGRSFHDRIYVYERDAGLLMYYRQGEATVQARARELVIGFLAAAGNYAYGLNWVFRQDGSFAFEAELAGQVLTKLVSGSKCQACEPAAGTSRGGDERRAEADDRYGTMVHPHVVGVDHQHWFNLRLDFDVDGPNNAVAENEVSRVAPPGQSSDTAPYFTVTHRLLERAVEAKRDADDEKARSWTVYNASARGATGHPAGYTIVPAGNTATVFPRPRERGPAGFTFHHVWVTPYRDGELYAGGKYPNQPPADYADALYHAGEASIYDRDIVVWYSLGETHVVRPEDYPLMSNMKLSVRFVPDGFFARNPALGRAVEEGKSP
jgi:primary-amine oxidase